MTSIEQRHKCALDITAATFQSFPFVSNLLRVSLSLAPQALPARENPDSAEGSNPSLPSGPLHAILKAHALRIGHNSCRLSDRGNHSLAPTPVAEIVLRRILNALLDRQDRGDVLTEVGADLSVRGRDRENEIAVGPFVAIARNPLRVLRACVLECCLVQVVVGQVVGGQDDKVGGPQEANPLQDDAQGAAVDALKAMGLVVNFHDGRDQVGRLRRRLTVFVVRHCEPRRRHQEQEHPHHDAQKTARAEARDPGGAPLRTGVRCIARRRCHTFTVTRRSGSCLAAQLVSRQEDGTSGPCLPLSPMRSRHLPRPRRRSDIDRDTWAAGRRTSHQPSGHRSPELAVLPSQRLQSLQ